VFVAKWKDNATVCIASNWLSHVPVHTVRRYVKPNPNPLVKQPDLTHQCNNGIGGVDVMDRLLSTYTAQRYAARSGGGRFPSMFRIFSL
jgi:hypothetical protein